MGRPTQVWKSLFILPMLLNYFGLFVQLVEPKPPTKEDILNKECPASRPFFCLAKFHALCCRPDEFCETERTRDCQSCFPRDIERKGGRELQQWCKDHGQHNITLLRHPGCIAACVVRFGVQTDVTEVNICKEDEYYNEEIGKCEACIPSDKNSTNESVKNWCAPNGKWSKLVTDHPNCAASCLKLFNALHVGKSTEKSNCSDDPLVAVVNSQLISIIILIVVVIILVIILIIIKIPFCKKRLGLIVGGTTKVLCSKKKPKPPPPSDSEHSELHPPESEAGSRKYSYEGESNQNPAASHLIVELPPSESLSEVDEASGFSLNGFCTKKVKGRDAGAPSV